MANPYLVGGMHLDNEKPSKKRSKKRKKTVRYIVSRFLLICAVCTVVLGATEGSLAYITSSSAVNNDFDAGQVTCRVDETFSGNIKSNVYVTNTSNVPAYIRATYTVVWKNASGEIYGKAPVKDTDYTVNLGTGWTDRGNGYYSYDTPVQPGGVTPNLINSISQIGKDIAGGYTLCVEISAEAIQSEPAKARLDAWGF